ncbi:MAG: hypothetical protein SGI91_23400 [Alphaproteobacteria bacterium]|jgi:hypothetical protein|nr:hypothetical protein [Alphaproteobacteria bacterium]
MVTERRAHKRYVIDGLMVELAGVVHETVDISVRAVAVVIRPGVDYAALKPPFRFTSEKAEGLNRHIPNMRRLYERGRVVVVDYFIDDPEWDNTLAAYDVRADVKPLEDVFG